MRNPSFLCIAVTISWNAEAFSVVKNNKQSLRQSAATPNTAPTNIHFEDWIADAPDEIRDFVTLSTAHESKIPSYLHNGTLVRNGGAIWGRKSDFYSHIFDGLAKISVYRFMDDGSSIQYLNKFIDSRWYQKVIAQTDELPPSLAVGPVLVSDDDTNATPKLGLLRLLRAVVNMLAFDNTPVNIWDYNPTARKGDKSIAAITDAPARAELAFDSSFQTTYTGNAPKNRLEDSNGYEMLSTAHPQYSKTDDSTYNVVIELGLSGPRVSLTRETADGQRRVVGSSEVISDGVPYMHSFGLTHRHAVILLQPLRANLTNLLQTLEMGFLRAMHKVEQTRVLVFDLHSGSVVLDESTPEKVYFYHTISTAEWDSSIDDSTKISMRLCAYRTPDMLTGEHQFMRLEQARRGLEWRNLIPKGGTFCDIECIIGSNENGSVAIRWNEKITQGFELPTTRYSREYGKDASRHTQQHPRYVYAFGSYANDSPDYDSWGIFKFDMKHNTIAACYQQASLYPSEPIFVADPNENDQDDGGVILSQVYDGIRQESALLILNARDLSVINEIWTNNRSPMDFHGAWIPGKS